MDKTDRAPFKAVIKDVNGMDILDIIVLMAQGMKVFSIPKIKEMEPFRQKDCFLFFPS